MPEQLTKHPEVTLQVLRSGGARCGEGLAPAILTQCPAERFCRLPGGELCVYGLSDARQMTQISAAEWRALQPAAMPVPPASAPARDAAVADGLDGVGLAVGLVAGLLGGLVGGHAMARRRRDPAA